MSRTYNLTFNTVFSDARHRQLCHGYLKDYGVLPQESWGTAPRDVQDDWKRKVGLYIVRDTSRSIA